MKQNLRWYLPLAVLAFFPVVPAGAGDLAIALPSGITAERHVAHYQCPGLGKLQVEYVNAGAISLAILPLEGQTQMFAQVLSGSGARYASGPYVWWIKGSEGSLQDLRKGENAPPVVCQGAP